MESSRRVFCSVKVQGASWFIYGRRDLDWLILMWDCVWIMSAGGSSFASSRTRSGTFHVSLHQVRPNQGAVILDKWHANILSNITTCLPKPARVMEGLQLKLEKPKQEIGEVELAIKNFEKAVKGSNWKLSGLRNCWTADWVWMRNVPCKMNSNSHNMKTNSCKRKEEVAKQRGSVMTGHAECQHQFLKLPTPVDGVAMARPLSCLPQES